MIAGIELPPLPTEGERRGAKRAEAGIGDWAKDEVDWCNKRTYTGHGSSEKGRLNGGGGSCKTTVLFDHWFLFC